MVIRMSTQCPREEPEAPAVLSTVAQVQATTARCAGQGPCPLKAIACGQACWVAIRDRSCPRLLPMLPTTEEN